jgi:methyl-accepting chemotaxis protein
MRFSIGTKLWLGFAPIVLVLAVVGVTSYRSTAKQSETAAWVAHTHVVLTRLAALLSSLQDAETGQRGYVITGEDRYLEPYRLSLPHIDSQLGELRRLTADNPAQQQRLDQLTPLVGLKLKALNEAIQARHAMGFDAARRVLLTDKGKVAMDRIRQQVGSMREEETGLLRQREAEAAFSAQRTYWVIGVGFALALLAVLTAAALLTRLIAAPLAQVTAAAEIISSGDLSAPLAIDPRRDEVGQLQRAFARMVQSLKEKAEVARRIAAGDLTVTVNAESEQDVAGQAFGAMVDNLREINRELTDSANVLAAAASQILASTTQIAAGAEETASSVSETTATVEEIKQTALVSSQKARMVSDSAQHAAEVAQGGRRAVDEVVGGMHRIQTQMGEIAESIVRLSEQTQAIGEIIASVNDLAEQSNLLAVNAAIEAAKAGEQGKGFAVVAQEVKSLAEQSKQATVQVRAILGDIQKATTGAVLATEQGGKAVEAGVQQSNAAGEAIRQLAEGVVESAQAATQIAVSAQQQLAGMDQLALAMDNIRSASEQNVLAAKQSEQAAQNLHDLGLKLQDMLSRYRM